MVFEMPRLHVVPDADWLAFLAAHGIRRADVPYWRIFGNAAAPGAFFDSRTNCIHVKHSRQADERLLLHEYGHAAQWHNHDHPRTILAGILHAIDVGFDSRAFTTLLRWFKPSKARVYDYRTWRQILVAIQ